MAADLHHGVVIEPVRDHLTQGRMPKGVQRHITSRDAGPLHGPPEHVRHAVDDVGIVRPEGWWRALTLAYAGGDGWPRQNSADVTTGTISSSIRSIHARAHGSSASELGASINWKQR